MLTGASLPILCVTLLANGSKVLASTEKKIFVWNTRTKHLEGASETDRSIHALRTHPVFTTHLMTEYGPLPVNSQFIPTGQVEATK